MEVLKKVKAQPPVNAELSVKKKLNQARNSKEQKKKKDGKNKNKMKDKGKEKKENAKKTNKAKKNRLKKPTTKAANDEDEEGEGQDEDHAEEKEEETQEEDAQESQEKTSTHAKGRKKGTVATAAAGQFSLGHAQKESKKAELMKKPAAVGSKDRQTKNSESNKEKKGQKKQKNTEKEETPNMGTADGGVVDDENFTQETRAKRRNRLTSNAYHTTLDAHKPKKKDGYVPNSQEWDAKMEKAKELARGAHGAAGRKFDEENPKEGEEAPAREEIAKPKKEKTPEVAQQKQGEGGSNAKKTKKTGEDKKTWTRPRNVD